MSRGRVDRSLDRSAELVIGSEGLSESVLKCCDLDFRRGFLGEIKGLGDDGALFGEPERSKVGVTGISVVASDPSIGNFPCFERPSLNSIGPDEGLFDSGNV